VFVFDTIRFLMMDLLVGILYFPVWWYTVGLMKVVHMMQREAKGIAYALNLKILFRFLLKPMFGQYDIWGRIISFGVRIVHFFILFVWAIILTVLLLVLLVVWLLLPPFLVWNILYHLGLDPGLATFLPIYE